jgi:hypothetical protein
MTNPYYIHDNGGRPYKVLMEYPNVYVFRETDETTYEEKPFLVFENVIQTFIGKSPINKMTKFSQGYGKVFDGNTILLQIKDKYIFIGSSIFSFESYANIVKFVSPVGNNDVPYPYAVDINDDYYLLIEDTVLKSKINKNPYNHYYDNMLMTTDLGMIPPKEPKIKTHIKEFYIGDEPYTMTLKINPEEDYDRLVKHIGTPLSIINEKDEKIILSKKDYVKIMTDFGEKLGIRKIKNKIMY